MQSINQSNHHFSKTEEKKPKATERCCVFRPPPSLSLFTNYDISHQSWLIPMLFSPFHLLPSLLFYRFTWFPPLPVKADSLYEHSFSFLYLSVYHKTCIRMRQQNKHHQKNKNQHMDGHTHIHTTDKSVGHPRISSIPMRTKRW